MIHIDTLEHQSRKAGNKQAQARLAGPQKAKSPVKAGAVAAKHKNHKEDPSKPSPCSKKLCGPPTHGGKKTQKAGAAGDVNTPIDMQPQILNWEGSLVHLRKEQEELDEDRVEVLVKLEEAKPGGVDVSKEEEDLKNMLWTQRKGEAWLSNAELHRKKRELDALCGLCKLAKLLNKNHQIWVMLKCNNKVVAKQGKICKLMQKGETPPEEVVAMQAELEMQVKCTVWRCVVYNENKLTDRALNYLIWNKHSSPAKGVCHSERAWWLTKKFNHKIMAEINKGNGKENRKENGKGLVKQLEAAGIVQVQWQQELEMKMVMTRQDEEGKEKGSLKGKQIGDITSQDKMSWLFLNPITAKGQPNAASAYKSIHVNPIHVPPFLKFYEKEENKMFSKWYCKATKLFTKELKCLNYNNDNVICAVHSVFNQLGMHYNHQSNMERRAVCMALRVYARLPMYSANGQGLMFYPAAMLTALHISCMHMEKWDAKELLPSAKARLSKIIMMFKDPCLSIALQAVEEIMRKEKPIRTLINNFYARKSTPFHYIGAESLFDLHRDKLGSWDNFQGKMTKAQSGIKSMVNWEGQTNPNAIRQVIEEHPVMKLINESFWKTAFLLCFTGWQDAEPKRMGTVGVVLGWGLLEQHLVDEVMPALFQDQRVCWVLWLTKYVLQIAGREVWWKGWFRATKLPEWPEKLPNALTAKSKSEHCHLDMEKKKKKEKEKKRKKAELEEEKRELNEEKKLEEEKRNLEREKARTGRMARSGQGGLLSDPKDGGKELMTGQGGSLFQGS
ncbi:hypothetical protein FRC07_004208 [Ceratobasidium sp. 392]|nr:hypothetical protein FRC07_004208 [Ceratobasidium sp. 392]